MAEDYATEPIAEPTEPTTAPDATSSAPVESAALAEMMTVPVTTATAATRADATDAQATAQAQQSATEATTADPRTAFLAALRARLATANYGLSASLGMSFSAQGLLLLEANDPQEALRAASAALDGAGDATSGATGDGGRVWRFLGCGLDLDTGRYRAVIRLTPQL